MYVVLLFSLLQLQIFLGREGGGLHSCHITDYVSCLELFMVVAEHHVSQQNMCTITDSTREKWNGIKIIRTSILSKL